MPRTAAGEIPEQLERFDLRGLDDAGKETILRKMYRRVDALVKRFGYVAIRAMVAMTPMAALLRIVSPKAAKSAHFKAGDPLADNKPIVQWLPFSKVESSLEAYEVVAEWLYPQALREEYDEEELLDGFELLLVEITWSK